MIKLALLAYVIASTLLLGAAGIGLVFSSVHSILGFDKGGRCDQRVRIRQASAAIGALVLSPGGYPEIGQCRRLILLDDFTV